MAFLDAPTLSDFCRRRSRLRPQSVVTARCAIEIEPQFVDIAITRWQAFTGRDAVRVGADMTFDELAELNTSSHAQVASKTGREGKP